MKRTKLDGLRGAIIRGRGGCLGEGLSSAPAGCPGNGASAAAASSDCQLSIPTVAVESCHCHCHYHCHYRGCKEACLDRSTANAALKSRVLAPPGLVPLTAGLQRCQVEKRPSRNKGTEPNGITGLAVMAVLVVIVVVVVCWLGMLPQ